MLIMVMFVVLAPITARYGVNETVFPISGGPEPVPLAAPGSMVRHRRHRPRPVQPADLRPAGVAGDRPRARRSSATVVGVTVGAVAGLRGGVFDDILMRVTDIFLAFPFLVALLVVRNVPRCASPWLEPIIGTTTSLRFIIFLFVMFGWMGVARLVRGQVLSLKEREFIEAARAARRERTGASSSSTCCPTPSVRSSWPSPRRSSPPSSPRRRCRSSASARSRARAPRRSATWSREAERRSSRATGGWSCSRARCSSLVALCINFIGDGLRDATDPKLPSGSQLMPDGEPVLSLRDFRVSFNTMNGDVQAVRGIDLDVGAARWSASSASRDPASR